MHATLLVSLAAAFVGAAADLAPVAVTAATSDRTQYPDGRPAAKYRLPAADQGVVLRHGDGPRRCDIYGARDAWVFQADGRYCMHYDAAGPTGWLAAAWPRARTLPTGKRTGRCSNWASRARTIRPRHPTARPTTTAGPGTCSTWARLTPRRGPTWCRPFPTGR